jgi:hypothetical protein
MVKTLPVRQVTPGVTPEETLPRPWKSAIPARYPEATAGIAERLAATVGILTRTVLEF